MSNFIATGRGRARPQDLAQFRVATRDYLKAWETYHHARGLNRDAALLGLIEDQGEGLDSAMAVLACLTSLSGPVASHQLASLIRMDRAVYRRCLVLSVMIEANILRPKERDSVLAMHDEINVETLTSLLKAFLACRPSTFLPDHMIVDWLRMRSIGVYLDAEVASSRESQRPHSAYRLIQCIKHIHGLPGGPELLVGRDLPRWPALMCWTPDARRLRQWESGCLTTAQKHQLSHILDLDGPDTVTMRQASLLSSVPACFSHVEVQPRTTGQLERLLTLLSRAELIGNDAVRLFIHTFVEVTVAEPTAFAFFERALQNFGSDVGAYGKLAELLQPRDQTSDICTQMAELGSFLRLGGLEGLPEGIRMLSLPARVASVLEAAQQELVEQMETGPGDYVGMRILKFGQLVLSANWIHPGLPPRVLGMIRGFPEPDVAEAIFERLADAATPSGHFQFLALKSYLVSRLSGQPGLSARAVDISDIQEEVDFWKQDPDTDRQDLARLLSGFRNLDYKAYTSCLTNSVHEKDMFIKELRVKLADETRGACVQFIEYLALRRGHGQLSAPCWTSLLLALIEERGHLVTDGASQLKTLDEWLGFVRHICQLVTMTAVDVPLRHFGDGITQNRLSWWLRLSTYEKELRLIQRLVRGSEDVSWLFLAATERPVLSLLEHVSDHGELPTLSRCVVSRLRPDGGNISLVADILTSLARLSRGGKAVVEKTFDRASRKSGRSGWKPSLLGTLCHVWLEIRPPSHDRQVLGNVAKLLDVLPRLSQRHVPALLGYLLAEHGSVLDRARRLEASRWKLNHKNTTKHSKLLREAGIKSTTNRYSGGNIPSQLLDAVSEVAPKEYELAFPLTWINDLRRQARGVPEGARLLLIRISLETDSGFCIHYSPDDEAEPGRHRYWRTSSTCPDLPACHGKPGLFSYGLARTIHRLLRSSPSLEKIHGEVEKWVATSPSYCDVCGASTGIKLWKAIPCSAACSTQLRRAPLEVRLHNLLVDPLALDLLLASVYAAASEPADLNLLPGCPVARDSLMAVLDALPPTAVLARAPVLAQCWAGGGTHAQDQEKLLSWLCLSFRGLLRTAPSGYVIPSMPGSQQFLLMHSHPERERAFAAHLPAPAGTAPSSSSSTSAPVFHGTHLSRLYRILTEGIRNVSHTALARNGAASGPGIYCADEQATSWSYASAVGRTWRNSVLQADRHVMLGCEMAGYPAAPTTAHVVQDETRVQVRYVWLLPAAYQSPPRRHVAPAMSTSFSMLRSGRAM